MTRVTMRDVARRSGVSIQTVSAVLNGKPGISVATIEQVRQAITELGYQPNLLASSLRSRRSTTVGLLLPNVANPYFAEIARGVEDVAQARGYSVILGNHDEDPIKRDAYLQLFRQYQVSGVIGPVGPQDKSGQAMICIEYPRVDDQRGGYVATAHLLELGHRRIGCITGPHPTKHGPGQGRLIGYRAALTDWAVAMSGELVVVGAFDFASGQQAARILLERTGVQRLTAIFAHNDLMAIGAMAFLKTVGLRVPDDIAVIGYDGAEIASLYDPALTTIVQPTYEMGTRAMKVLADLVEGGTAPADDPWMVDCQLIVRRSTVPDLAEQIHCGSISAERSWQVWRTLAGDHQGPTPLSQDHSRATISLP